MILNSSGTAGCDQTLKQMMYGGRKLERRESLGEGERGKEKEKKKTEVQGHYNYPQQQKFSSRKSSVLFKRLGHDYLISFFILRVELHDRSSHNISTMLMALPLSCLICRSLIMPG